MKILSSDMPQTVAGADVLDVAADTRAVLIEDAPLSATKITVGDGAVVTHYRLNKDNDNVTEVTVGEGASYTLITVHVGGGKSEINAHLNGCRAVCRSDVLYVLNGTDHAAVKSDFRHNANETVSSQVIKGVVFGHAQALFEGGVFIPYDKKAVDGSQQHRALLLSDDAEVKAVPKLEIYSDDVKCAHGSAVGSLDAGELFYLQARGIPEPQAQELLTEGFLNEVLLKVGDDAFRARLMAEVREKAGFDK